MWRAEDELQLSEKLGTSETENLRNTCFRLNNAHVILGAMSKTLPYDTIKSFDPVGQIAAGGLFAVTHPSFEAKNIKELVEFAKRTPERYLRQRWRWRRHDAALYRREFKQIAVSKCCTFLIAGRRRRSQLFWESV
jgi:hypothetical protein